MDNHPTKNNATATELNRAVEIAEDIIVKAGELPSEYQLTSATSMLTPKGVYRGPAFWHLTFKRRDLIPADAESEIGAGGMLFVEVDLAIAHGALMGRGE